MQVCVPSVSLPRAHAARGVGLGLLAGLWFAAAPVEAKPWKGGELISHQTFEYGAFEARVRAARGSGMITPFFLWKNDSELASVPWQELDFEIFGRDGGYQTQLMTPGTGGAERTEHVRYHSLPEPAWERYSTYRIEWTPEYVAFYVDGELVRRETDREEFAIFFEPSQSEPMQLRLSLWAGDSSWSGAFDPGAVPAAVFVNWVEVYSYTPGAGPGGSDFTRAFRDDFDTLDGQRWWTANWTFEHAVNDYVAHNITTRDGKLIIVLTDESAAGEFPSPPPDSGGSPPDALPITSGGCSAGATIAASEMHATTGAATADGWNLWTLGTLSTEHEFSGGGSVLTVSARGQLAAGQWPHMTVLAGDRVIGEASVEDTSFAPYEFFFDAAPGTQTLSIRFDNDYYEGGEDRNLYIEALHIEECGQ